ncbi:MAG TPA: hypothetical protein VFX92_06935 [Candidatus Krumholzibacteria bacterium]|nr:hypothetical protein [Candidatus Krumholzibacteria bacterium]
MNRKIFLLGAVVAFGAAAAVAGVGKHSRASACDEATTTAATSSSCCAKMAGATAASADAGKTHGAMGVVASGDGCGWCPEAAAATCPVSGASASCDHALQASAASMSGCTQGAAVKTAGSDGCAGMKTAAAAAGCDKSMTAAAGSACEKGAAVAAGGDACCKNGAAAAASKEACKETCEETKTAALKGVVDELPYRENKRVVVAGTYACAHCTLHATETCAPVFKTADGKVYPLIRNPLAADLRKADTGNGLEIATSVKKIDGVKYLEVKSYKVL